jgi:hypothetical protein
LDDLPVPSELSEKQRDLISELGRLWAEDPQRPRLQRGVRERWEKLIDEWAETNSLPLYVRKAKGNRGWKIRHAKGRLLVPTDNSPAIWAFVLAYTRKTPSINEVKNTVHGDGIPIAFALTKAEKNEGKRYKCTLSSLRKAYPNAAKWKFAHIEPVGLKRREILTQVDVSVLKDRFKKLMNPSNIFVVRKKWSGLAEVPEFIDGIKGTDGVY